MDVLTVPPQPGVAASCLHEHPRPRAGTREPLTVPIDVIIASVPFTIAVRVPLVVIWHVGAVVTGVPKGVGV